jgi:hypothetical protein
MWEPVGEEKIFRGVRASCLRSREDTIDDDDYNMAIFFSSFESRTLVGSQLLKEKSCRDAVVVLFKEAEEHALRRSHDAKLLEQVRRVSKNDPRVIVDASVKGAEHLVEDILCKAPPSAFGLNSRWFVDLGGAPSSCYIGLLGYLRELHPAPRMTLFNPTGSYGDSQLGYSFTEGFEEHIWAPRFWGQPNPLLSWHYVFLMGFEGERCVKVLEECEPSIVSAILADPGYGPKDANEALSRNEIFLREASLTEKDLIRCNAANPTEIWQVLEDLVKRDDGKHNFCFVPLGTKGHAVGCALCAMALPDPAILFHIPRVYSIRDAKRGEYLWRYEITL